MVTEAKKDSPNQEASKPGAQMPEFRRRWTDVPALQRENSFLLHHFVLLRPSVNG